MARYFFALWPDDTTRQQIANIVELLPEETGRRVALTNLHITLAFLGNVDESLIQGLCTGAATLHGQAFSLALDKMGWWKRPRVAWLAPTRTPAALSALVAEINGLAAGNHLPVDTRPYRPHLTIARKVSRFPGAVKIDPILWNISNFCLVESNTLETGAVYKVVDRWPLSSV